MNRYLFSIFFVTSGVIHAQDIEHTSNSQTFSHSGTVALSTVSQFNPNSANPFTYMLFANYTPEFSGISMPFSILHSNLKISCGRSFSSWQFAPSYRWIRTQFGESDIQLSPYSLSGHRFRGAVVDIQPNRHWTISALYGRLNTYRSADSNNPNGSLQRLCYGTKIAYNNSIYGINGSFFKAKDLAKTDVGVAPQENVVISFSGHWILAKNIRVSGDFASSALTKNTNDELVHSDLQIRSLAGSFLPYRLSTAVFHAYKINIGSPFLNVGYEYVAPHYQSLGTHFFTNDFENFTINGLHRFRNVTVGGRFGVQNDDLNNSKIHSSRRLVYAANLDYSGDSRIFGQLNYSTFQTFTRAEKFLTEFENTNPHTVFDTLAFRQVEQHGDLAIGYRLRETANAQQQIQLFVSLQNASENGRFATSSLNYTRSQRSGKNLGLSTFFHHDVFENENRSSFGLTAFFSDVFSEKRGRWRIVASKTQDLNHRNALVLRASASYVFQKKHPVQIQFSQRFNKNYSAMITLNYGYSFGQ